MNDKAETAGTRVCAKCEKTVDVGDMARYPSGGMKKVCKKCNKSRGAAAAIATPAAAKSKDKLKKAKPEALALEITAGYGLRAKLDTDVLVIEQDDQDGGVDTVAISRDEFKRLFGHFSAWHGC